MHALLYITFFCGLDPSLETVTCVEKEIANSKVSGKMPCY